MSGTERQITSDLESSFGDTLTLTAFRKANNSDLELTIIALPSSTQHDSISPETSDSLPPYCHAFANTQDTMQSILEPHYTSRFETELVQLEKDVAEEPEKLKKARKAQYKTELAQLKVKFAQELSQELISPEGPVSKAPDHKKRLANFKETFERKTEKQIEVIKKRNREQVPDRLNQILQCPDFQLLPPLKQLCLLDMLFAEVRLILNKMRSDSSSSVHIELSEAQPTDQNEMEATIVERMERVIRWVGPAQALCLEKLNHELIESHKNLACKENNDYYLNQLCHAIKNRDYLALYTNLILLRLQDLNPEQVTKLENQLVMVNNADDFPIDNKIRDPILNLLKAPEDGLKCAKALQAIRTEVINDDTTKAFNFHLLCQYIKQGNYVEIFSLYTTGDFNSDFTEDKMQMISELCRQYLDKPIAESLLRLFAKPKPKQPYPSLTDAHKKVTPASKKMLYEFMCKALDEDMLIVFMINFEYIRTLGDNQKIILFDKFDQEYIDTFTDMQLTYLLRNIDEEVEQGQDKHKRIRMNILLTRLNRQDRAMLLNLTGWNPPFDVVSQLEDLLRRRKKYVRPGVNDDSVLNVVNNAIAKNDAITIILGSQELDNSIDFVEKVKLSFTAWRKLSKTKSDSPNSTLSRKTIGILDNKTKAKTVFGYILSFMITIGIINATAERELPRKPISFEYDKQTQSVSDAKQDRVAILHPHHLTT